MIFESQTRATPSPGDRSASIVRPMLQRKCACGGTPGPSGECEGCKRKRLALQTKLAINQPGDRFEQEADRMADAVVSGRGADRSLNPAPAAAVQRDDDAKNPPPPAKPNNYDEAAKKIADALQETSVGRELKAKAEELGKDFLSSVEGKVVAGSALGGALAAIIATNSELPVGIPEVPLDFIAPGLKAKLTYEGPVQKPTNVGLTLTSKGGKSLSASYTKTIGEPGKPAETKAGLTLTIPLGGSSAKKKGSSESDKIAADTARLGDEQARIREAMKTPAEKRADEDFMKSYLHFKANDPLNPLNIGKKKDDLLLMRSAAGEAASSSAPPIVHDTLAGSGQPLDRETRSFMEARFSHDFSRVRIHTDARAAESARAVNAAAYTVGDQIVFAAGRYSPRSQDGRRLLAHELTHTLQQGGAQQLRRYTVPSTLACDEVVPWLNSNSPYAPEWAETRCTYSFNGGAQVNGTTLPDGKVRADVKGSPTATVTVNCPVDRPQWNPSKRTNQAAEASAWSAMRATLDAHESAHKKIGATWQGTLQSRFRAVDFSITGKDKTEAMANATAELQKQQTQWQSDAQAAQDTIDPFRGAVLACP